MVVQKHKPLVMPPLKHKGKIIYNTFEKYKAIFDGFFPKIEDLIEFDPDSECPEGLDPESTEINDIIPESLTESPIQ